MPYDVAADGRFPVERARVERRKRTNRRHSELDHQMKRNPRHASAARSMLVWIAWATAAQQRPIDGFFRQLSDGWVRLNPNLAVFDALLHGRGTGSPGTADHVVLGPPPNVSGSSTSRKGLAELGSFDRARLTDAERLSADLLRYQLQQYLDWREVRRLRVPARSVQRREHQPGERALGAARHPHAAGTRRTTSRVLDRSPRVWRKHWSRHEQRAAKDLIPPRFILNLTITQMRRFVETPAGAESARHVAGASALSRIKELAPAERAALVVESRAHRLASACIRNGRRRSRFWNRSCRARPITPGLWRLEGGAAAYAHFLKGYHDDEPDAGRDPRDRPASGGTARARDGRRVAQARAIERHGEGARSNSSRKI